MERLLEILGLLAGLAERSTAEDLTDEQIDELDAEIGSLETELLSIFDELVAEEDSDVDALTQCADAIDGLRALAGQRYEAEQAAADAADAAEAERQAALDALQSRVHGDPEPVEDPEDEPVVDPAPVDEDPAEDPPADDPADDPEVVEDPELEPVAAAAARATAVRGRPAPTSRTTMRKHQKARTRPREEARLGMQIRRAGGGTFNDRVEVEDALFQMMRDLEGTSDGSRHRVATFAAEYPKDRIFPEGKTTDVEGMALEVRAKAAEPGGIEALTADGGLCGPVDTYYGLTTISQASRPLRSSLAQYQSKRGGLRWMTPLTLASINSATTPTVGNAIGVVTEAQDAASTFDKSVQAISCGTTVEKRIDAVYLQLQFGQFISMTNPERTSQFTDLSIAAYARFNEQRLFNAMIANSTAQHGQQELGASRDLVNGLNRQAINYRARHRMDPDATLTVVIPEWVGMGLIPNDQMKALQSFPEQFTLTDAWLADRLRERRLEVIWFQDDFTTAVANGAGVNAFPTTFTSIMYHPGAHVYIDQGELNLGVIRDSVTTVSNIYNTFMEEFWTTGMWGIESLATDWSLCANGASAGSVTPHCGS